MRNTTQNEVKQAMAKIAIETWNSNTGNAPVLTENQNDPINANLAPEKPYLKIGFGFSERISSIGGEYSCPVLMVFEIYTPLNQGETLMGNIVEAMTLKFERNRRLPFGIPNVRVTPQNLGTSEDGGWYHFRLNLSFNYYIHDFGQV